MGEEGGGSFCTEGRVVENGAGNLYVIVWRYVVQLTKLQCTGWSDGKHLGHRFDRLEIVRGKDISARIVFNNLLA